MYWFFSILRSEIFGAMLNFRFASDEHGFHGPWKVLEKASCPWKVLENWKIVGWPWKVLEFSTEVLEYFWKLLLREKKHVLRRGMIEKNSNTQFFFGYHESVFLWFWCSWHSSFSVLWSTLGTVPKWRKVSQ